MLSKFIIVVTSEGFCHKEHTSQYESPMSNGKKVMYRVKVFQMKVKCHGQGHMLKIYGTVGKVLS